MRNNRNIHPRFFDILIRKNTEIIHLFYDLRQMILELSPDCNEILYYTHALTAVFSLSDSLSHAFCHVPIYSQHINLGFNKGALLNDPNNLFEGSRKLIRHIKIKNTHDYRNPNVHELIVQAILLAQNELGQNAKVKGQTICKIKTS